jgi:phage terminase large subunit GpA-like protein
MKPSNWLKRKYKIEIREQRESLKLLVKNSHAGLEETLTYFAPHNNGVQQMAIKRAAADTGRYAQENSQNRHVKWKISSSG